MLGLRRYMRHNYNATIESRAENTERFDDLLDQLVAWEGDAGMGDNGESPTVKLERSDGRWTVRAYSFYDGGGRAVGADLEECMQQVLNEIYQEPEKEQKREFESAAWAIARWKHISLDAAKQWLDSANSQ